MLVHLRLPSPLGTRVLSADPSSSVSALLPPLPDCYVRSRAALVDPASPLGALAHAANPAFPVELEIVPRIRGGKGGFGANLRAAGGRMNASKSTNFDSCRDLNGRRLGAVKEAQRQADLVESLPELQAKAAAEEKAKLETLERRLGLSASDTKSTEGTKRLAEVDLEELARKKHKFEDDKFLEESREINESVRSAVGAALLKKKKKKVAADKDKAPAKAAVASTSKAVAAAPKAAKATPTAA